MQPRRCRHGRKLAMSYRRWSRCWANALCAKLMLMEVVSENECCEEGLGKPRVELDFVGLELTRVRDGPLGPSDEHIGS